MSQRKTYTVMVEQRLLTYIDIEAGSRYEAYTAARDLVLDPEYIRISEQQRGIALNKNQMLEHRHSIRLVD